LIATLLDSYEQNPQQVRDQLRQQLSFAGQLIVRLISIFFIFSNFACFLQKPGWSSSLA